MTRRLAECAERRSPLARGWLLLATLAVSASGVFALLIALARVPALGALFPGVDFYRVALTLHVNLSQGVWFMAFAASLWCLPPGTPPRLADRLALLMAVVGALGIVASVAVGHPSPLMSNYLPVLDSSTFLGSLALFVSAVLVVSIRRLWFGLVADRSPVRVVEGHALRLAAGGFLAAVAVAFLAWLSIRGRLTGHAYFEWLFWGGGHVFQSVLVILMMLCWLRLAAPVGGGIRVGTQIRLLWIAALPIPFGFATALFLDPISVPYMLAYTRLMQWLIWPAALFLLLVVLFRGGRASAPGLRLSGVLFVVGLCLGVLINGETTLVTAHYHGTIGAATLAFMALAIRLLPAFGAEPLPDRRARLPLGLYGYGIALMMAGLAGAGWMGAPRKAPGELAVSWGVETVSRIGLGLGGLSATVGLLLFGALVGQRLMARNRQMEDVDDCHGQRAPT